MDPHIGPRATERLQNTVVKQHAETIAGALVARIEAWLWAQARAVGADAQALSERLRALGADDWLRSELDAKVGSVLDLADAAAKLGLQLSVRASAEPAPVATSSNRLMLVPATAASVGPGDDFVAAWTAGDIFGLPIGICRTEDLYRAYCAWAQRHGDRPAPMNWCVAGWRKTCMVRRVRLRRPGEDRIVQSVVVVPPGHEGALRSRHDLANETLTMNRAVIDFCQR